MKPTKKEFDKSLWDMVFGKLKKLGTAIEMYWGPGMNIDDVDYRFVCDRIEYYEAEDRLLTKEEMKMVNETKKILGDDSIQLTATCVRLPVTGGHSEAVNVQFENPFELEAVKEILSATDGIIIEDNPANNEYPMPLNAHNKDEVFVGRLRKDESQPNTLDMWIVSDNLRKGAATNAIQIAEYICEHKLVY